MPWHIVIKIMKSNNYDKNFKAVRENHYIQGKYHRAISWGFIRNFAVQKRIAWYIQSIERGKLAAKNIQQDYSSEQKELEFPKKP